MFTRERAHAQTNKFRMMRKLEAASPEKETADATGGLTVATLNVWGMPFASHAVLSRPARNATTIIQHVLMKNGHLLAPPGLSTRCVVCVQEAWAFKCGLGGPALHLARCFETCWPTCCTATATNTIDEGRLVSEILRVNSCCTLLAQLLALVAGRCCPLPWLRYDVTRAQLASALRPHGLPHATGMHGAAGSSWSFHKLMDSGLLILSSERPSASGFVGYTPPLAEESGVHKGILWALFDSGEGGSEVRAPCSCIRASRAETTTEFSSAPSVAAATRCMLTCTLDDVRLDGSLPQARACDLSLSLSHSLLVLSLPPYSPLRAQLVLTTHVHATSAEIRGAQRQQLIRVITELRARFSPGLVVLCGDMNEEAEGLLADFGPSPLAMSRLSESTPDGTCIDRDGTVHTLDHIFAAPARGEELRGCVAHPPVRTMLSDHSLVWVSGIRSEPPGRTEGV